MIFSRFIVFVIIFIQTSYGKDPGTMYGLTPEGEDEYVQLCEIDPNSGKSSPVGPKYDGLQPTSKRTLATIDEENGFYYTFVQNITHDAVYYIVGFELSLGIMKMKIRIPSTFAWTMNWGIFYCDVTKRLFAIVNGDFQEHVYRVYSINPQNENVTEVLQFRIATGSIRYSKGAFNPIEFMIYVHLGIDNGDFEDQMFGFNYNLPNAHFAQVLQVNNKLKTEFGEFDDASKEIWGIGTEQGKKKFVTMNKYGEYKVRSEVKCEGDLKPSFSSINRQDRLFFGVFDTNAGSDFNVVHMETGVTNSSTPCSTEKYHEHPCPFGMVYLNAYIKK